jgi:hypothetical protein
MRNGLFRPYRGFVSSRFYPVWIVIAHIFGHVILEAYVRVTSVQRVHKRMARFQKLTRYLFLTLTRAKRTPSAAATVQVSHALPAVFASHSCRGASFQDGVAAGKGFLCAPF